MSISRKEFLRKGLFALGQGLAECLNGGEPEKLAAALVDYPYLQLDNDRCLAQRGGCFACIDHCPKEAVNIALGVGIVINPELCDGCGECAAVCPVNPNVIQMNLSAGEPNKPMERRNE